MSDTEILEMIEKFKGILGRGNGQMTINFAGGKPKNIKVSMDGDALSQQKRVRIAS